MFKAICLSTCLFVFSQTDTKVSVEYPYAHNEKIDTTFLLNTTLTVKEDFIIRKGVYGSWKLKDDGKTCCTIFSYNEEDAVIKAGTVLNNIQLTQVAVNSIESNGKNTCGSCMFTATTENNSFVTVWVVASKKVEVLRKWSDGSSGPDKFTYNHPIADSGEPTTPTYDQLLLFFDINFKLKRL